MRIVLTTDETIAADVDIPEDVQTQLLQQYEQELMTAASTATATTDPVTTAPNTTKTDPDTSDSSVTTTTTTSTTSSSRLPQTQQPKSTRKTKATDKNKTTEKKAASSVKTNPGATKAPTPSQQMRQAATQKSKSAKTAKKQEKESPVDSGASTPVKSLSSKFTKDHRIPSAFARDPIYETSLAHELRDSLSTIDYPFTNTNVLSTSTGYSHFENFHGNRLYFDIDADHSPNFDVDETLGNCDINAHSSDCATNMRALVVLEDDIDVDLHEVISYGAAEYAASPYFTGKLQNPSSLLLLLSLPFPSLQHGFIVCLTFT